MLPGREPSTTTLVVNWAGSLRRVFRLPIELSLGEGYLRGSFDIEGEIWEAGPALEAARHLVRSPGDRIALLTPSPTAISCR